MSLLAAALLQVGAPWLLPAQVKPDSVRRDTMSMPPTIEALPAVTELQSPMVRRRAPLARAPIAPGRAFLLSFAVPGLAQAKLDRTTSGALFVAVEMASLAMLRRSQSDVAEVRRQRAAETPGNFRVDAVTGVVSSSGDPLPTRFDETLERTRRLHVEDWIAALAFNHLISAADAFVSAQLWDVPTRVAVYPTSQGWVLSASLRW